MSKLIEFSKVEATGNDFIFIDARKFSKEIFTPTVITNLCDRHFGIGADGLILIDNHKSSIFEMTIFNSDGLEANMCANGSRGAVLFAVVAGFIDCEEHLEFHAADGLHKAQIYAAGDVEIEVLYNTTENFDLSLLELPDNMRLKGFVNTGVPHLVIDVLDDINRLDVTKIGRKLRLNPIFGKNGTNVNFIEKVNDNELNIRSYERGIEDETLSCGTGITAAALLYFKKNSVKSEKIVVNSRGGKLKVTRKEDKLFLRGAVNIVYVGNLRLD
jgi:diaminopimelate epimerase